MVLQSARWGVGFTSNPNDTRIAPALLRAQEIGVGIARMVVSWDVVEPTTPGVRDFSKYVSIYNACVAAGMQVEAQLAFSSSWISSIPDGFPSQYTNRFPPTKNDPSMSAWSAFCTAAVAALPGVTRWEIWNEPDGPGFWEPSNTMDAVGLYAQLLSVASTAIKAAQPAATISLGGLAKGGANNRTTFFPDLLANVTYDPKSKFDVMNVHNYDDQSGLATKISDVNSQLAAVGVTGRPIWIGEIGRSANPANDSGHAADYRGGIQGQARYLRDLLPYALTLTNVQKVFWFELFDPGTVGNTNWYGLMDLALSRRPCLCEYQTVIAANP